MALYKEIRQSDDVITNYHRVLSVTQVVNEYTAVAVVSYVDVLSRSNDNADAEQRPYRNAITYQTEYDESMNVKSAYDYLKTLPQFEGAEDV